MRLDMVIPFEAIQPATWRRLVLRVAAPVGGLVDGGLDVHRAALHARAPELQHLMREAIIMHSEAINGNQHAIRAPELQHLELEHGHHALSQLEKTQVGEEGARRTHQRRGAIGGRAERRLLERMQHLMREAIRRNQWQSVHARQPEEGGHQSQSMGVVIT